MPPFKTLNWLISDACRQEAHAKYDIKLLECRLNILSTQKTVSSESIQCVLEALIQSYINYLQLLKKAYPLLESDPTCPSGETWHKCYRHILNFQARLSAEQNQLEKIRLIELLLTHYQYLIRLINPSVLHTKEKHLGNHLKILLAAKSPDTWLQALAQVQVQKLAGGKGELLRLASNELIQLANRFQQQAFLEPIHAVFFYKLHPEHLFAQIPHPEKQISVQTRLSLLYKWIESLHQALTQVLHERELGVLQDLLFHGEELPAGTEIEVNQSYHRSIQAVLKLLPTRSGDTKNEEILKQVDNIFRAYKFWFNPDRLVDAVMILKQRLLANNPSGQNQCLYQQMIHLYKQLTTTECLDLYGYFANKSSCYLMRTLLSIQQKQTHKWLPKLTEAEQLAIQHIYDDLDSVMEALRQELSARNIATEPYKRRLSGKAIAPGRRIRYAILRIIDLYEDKNDQNSLEIEHLFSLIEP